MRRLPTIIALSLALDCAGAAPVAAAWPQCFPCSASDGVAFRRDAVVLAKGGMGGGGGGMHCGPGCGGMGGSRGGMGGGSGGMGGGGGGMGGGSGGMGGGGGGMGGGGWLWNPFFAVPRANCADHRRKPDRRHTAKRQSQCPDSR